MFKLRLYRDNSSYAFCLSSAVTWHNFIEECSIACFSLWTIWVIVCTFFFFFPYIHHLFTIYSPSIHHLFIIYSSSYQYALFFVLSLLPNFAHHSNKKCFSVLPIHTPHSFNISSSSFHHIVPSQRWLTILNASRLPSSNTPKMV